MKRYVGVGDVMAPTDRELAEVLHAAQTSQEVMVVGQGARSLVVHPGDSNDGRRVLDLHRNLRAYRFALSEPDTIFEPNVVVHARRVLAQMIRDLPRLSRTHWGDIALWCQQFGLLLAEVSPRDRFSRDEVEAIKAWLTEMGYGRVGSWCPVDVEQPEPMARAFMQSLSWSIKHNFLNFRDLDTSLEGFACLYKATNL